MTYLKTASALQVAPPITIHKVTVALERLMEDATAANRPFIAVLMIRAMPGDFPQRAHFNCAVRLDRFVNNPDSQDAKSCHAIEVNATFAFWGATTRLVVSRFGSARDIRAGPRHVKWL